MYSITLTADECATLLDHLRRHPDPQLRQRAHILLLLADGYTWALIGAVLYCGGSCMSRLPAITSVGAWRNSSSWWWPGS